MEEMREIDWNHFWDKCKWRGFQTDYKNFPPKDRKLVKGMIISATYSGRTTIITVEEAPISERCKGVISGFEPPAETHDNLSVGDKVEIPEGYICWVHY